MSRPRVVIAGAGFAGYRTARAADRLSCESTRSPGPANRPDAPAEGDS